MQADVRHLNSLSEPDSYQYLHHYILFYDCSYTEAVPFVYSIPVFANSTISTYLILTVSDLAHSSTSTICIDIRFFGFSQQLTQICAPHDMAGWIRIYGNIATMTSLRYLCINISQMRSDFDLRSQDENANLIDGLLAPLKSIKVEQGGQFDVISQGWRVTPLA